MAVARIASMHVYPVKGCGGVAVSSADVAVTGLVVDGIGDREWMIVDATGRFVTQREYPRLAQVRTSMHPGAVGLHAPGCASLTLTARSAPSRDVVIWRNRVRGIDAGDEAAAWISSWLDADLRIARFDRTLQRPCNPEYAADTGAHTFFADGYPLLVISRESLDDLNGRLVARGSHVLPMNRFRPNIVVEGLDPYAEDYLATMEAGGVTLQCVKPCVRCQVTTTDQSSAQLGDEPLRTLAGYRMNERLGGVTFGMNAVVVAGAGMRWANGAPLTVTYAF
jgi:uncharacterized protein YcbX